MTANPIHPGEDNVRMLHPFADAWTADRLLDTEFPEPAWAIPGIVPEGLSVLAGAPKVGKSWLALCWALSVAAGGLALGSLQCDAGPVLYLALEDNPRRIQRRIRTVLDGAPAPSGLHLATDCAALGAGGSDDIAGWLDYFTGARMVVIDVFAKVRGQVAGSNAYADDYCATGLAKTIADRYQVAVVLVHHVRKMGSEDFLEELSGTNGIAGAADTVHVLGRERYDADGTLATTGRDVEETKRALHQDPRTHAWSLLDGPALDHTVHDTSATILRYVRGHQGASPREIADATGLAIDLTRKTCARMEKRDHLIRVGDGRYAAPPEPETGDLP
ncbi:AAA domain-containing protein [Kribbella orskensis]|uniref:AAA domain-containing protein n=1 Tax=Kribbella orskensis TaxID=2512216 RepID=A0ABY2BP28_9ACTN|nr:MULTISPECIES: AAA family ATPase [Kribbella]TCN39847.1 AAA domain-containing protein [Kribbella sp. VKM Ac-2500]TCO27370.1 AAA domain-containing protein [Kribbella orskensis]